MTAADFIDIPRFYTALAEWAACFIYILMLKKRFTGIRLGLSMAGLLILQTAFQYVAGLLPIWLWIPGMATAIVLMYFNIRLLCDISSMDAWFCCVKAFVLAEFVASLEWQLYVWWALKTGSTSLLVSISMMLGIYAVLFACYYYMEKQHLPREEKLNVGAKELVGAAAIALGAFLISNLSFVAPNTPFSSTLSSVLYVRTLVDFGGLVMLFAQQDKREEFRLRTENQAMNSVLQRQYEQYKLARDNMEFLRREFHDLKHYMIAIRAEKNPERKEHYLKEMEDAILMQEALTNTGNSILDVVLTTKSAYCTQQHINFSCLADGRLISFMDVKDICSIFGNALDNAIECVENISDPEKRLITLSLYRQKQLLMLQFENYYESDLVMQDNLPLTTKSNQFFHGYGLKSIRQAAENYGGTMTVHAKDNWFTLQVLIPIDN